MGKRYSAQGSTPPDAADRIKALRVRYDLTQTQLADLLGFSYAAVSRG